MTSGMPRATFTVTEPEAWPAGRWRRRRWRRRSTATAVVVVPPPPPLPLVPPLRTNARRRGSPSSEASSGWLLTTPGWRPSCRSGRIDGTGQGRRKNTGADARARVAVDAGDGGRDDGVTTDGRNQRRAGADDDPSGSAAVPTRNRSALAAAPVTLSGRRRGSERSRWCSCPEYGNDAAVHVRVGFPPETEKPSDVVKR